MPPVCGRPCSRTADGVRKWKRVDTAEGPRFRSALAPPHEAALLKNMVASVQGMLDEREAATPSDPLEQITGIRAGNPQPPDDTTMRRLLPDFFKPPQRDHPAGSAAAESLNGALRSLHEPDIIDAKKVCSATSFFGHPSGWWGPVRDHRRRRQRLGLRRERRPVGAGRDARDRPGGSRPSADRPSAGGGTSTSISGSRCCRSIWCSA